MPIPPPVLVQDSVEDFQCRFECTSIEHIWRTRDRSVVRNYSQFLLLRTRMQARIACCKATASRRSAIYHPFQFRRWLEQHKTGIPPPEDLFGGAPHVPGLWHSYRNTDGSWGPEGGIMDASRWLPARRVDDWSWHTPPLARRPGHPDPNWDGTPIPKTPGKGKRRKLRRHEAERHLALFHDAQSRAVGWETGTGWGGDWLTEPQWEMRLAEPRAALERAREALAVYYIM